MSDKGLYRDHNCEDGDPRLASDYSELLKLRITNFKGDCHESNKNLLQKVILSWEL